MRWFHLRLAQFSNSVLKPDGHWIPAVCSEFYTFWMLPERHRWVMTAWWFSSIIKFLNFYFFQKMFSISKCSTNFSQFWLYFLFSQASISFASRGGWVSWTKAKQDQQTWTWVHIVMVPLTLKQYTTEHLNDQQRHAM